MFNAEVMQASKSGSGRPKERRCVLVGSTGAQTRVWSSLACVGLAEKYVARRGKSMPPLGPPRTPLRVDGRVILGLLINQSSSLEPVCLPRLDSS